MRILVVDDERDVRRAFARAVKLDGLLPTEAGSAAEALERCDEHVYDVVVIDFIMPDMNGVELLTRIRRTQPFIRSILVSGKLDRQRDEKDIATDIRQAVEADVYLHKPVKTDALIATIRSLLDDKEAKDWKYVAARIKTGGEARIASANRAAKELRKHKVPRGARKK